MSSRTPSILFCIAATAGLFFASYSTFDFVQHLDRQVHDIHCSFVPGLVEAAGAEGEGCQVTMMSPYSSLFRTAIWGGLPISLPAMAVFAFLLFRGTELMFRPPGERKDASTILLLATLIPVGASAVMGYIAFAKLDAACKLCIGIYSSSATALLAAWWCRRECLREWVAVEKEPDASSPVAGAWLVALAQLGAFVGIPVLLYHSIAPDFSRYTGGCGVLLEPEDPYGVMVELEGGKGSVDAIEVFDPLCPACRAFEERLAVSGLASELHRRAVLFPLDSECNWMVSRSLHPGACAVSEAILCAADEAAVSVQAVTAWAFEQQEELRQAAERDPARPAKMALAKFPALKGCLGSAQVKAKLNKSLRWAVANRLPVLTPQLYIDGAKLCDEDTDLGLDYALNEMLKARAAGTLPQPTKQEKAAAAVEMQKEVAPPSRRPSPAPRNKSPRPATAPLPNVQDAGNNTTPNNATPKVEAAPVKPAGSDPGADKTEPPAEAKAPTIPAEPEKKATPAPKVEPKPDLPEPPAEKAQETPTPAVEEEQ